MAKDGAKATSVFLNIPYDERFSNLYISYIVAVASFGFLPKATLMIPGSRRLDRISSLIESCTLSLHDLSRVQLDRRFPATPRFNMPFELGLAVEYSRHNNHRWFVLESKSHRVLKSLSDVNGTDVYVHDGTIEGVMREACNIFVSSRRQPSVRKMMNVYRELRKELPDIQREAGGASMYSARCFSDLTLAAAVLVHKHIDI